MPRLNGRRITCAPCSRATSTVRSVEPSETTTISSPASKACSSSTTRPMLRSSLNAGTIAILLRAASRGSVSGGTLTTSIDTRAHLQLEQLEDATRAVAVRVLVERPLTRPAAELLGLGRIVEELAVGGGGLGRRVDDDELAPRLEPPLHPLARIRDDRGAGRRELEGPAGRRGVEARVRAPRDVEVDARRGDRAGEDVERDVAELARRSHVEAEVVAAEHEVGTEELA